MGMFSQARISLFIQLPQSLAGTFSLRHEKQTLPLRLLNSTAAKLGKDVTQPDSAPV